MLCYFNIILHLIHRRLPGSLHQWKHISLLWLSWSTGMERSPIRVTATTQLYVPPKGAGHPRDPQEVSQWSITVQNHGLSREYSQIESEGQTWLQGVWELCQTCGWRPRSSPGLWWTWCPALISGRATELSRGERRGARAMAETAGISAGEVWLLNGVSFSTMSFGWSVLLAPISETLYWVGWPQGKTLRIQLSRAACFFLRLLHLASINRRAVSLRSH